VNPIRDALLAMLSAYRRLLSPLLGPHCRFHPSCSHYATEALARHHTARGSYLALVRVLRCQPFSAGGYDPVPEPFTLTPWRAPVSDATPPALDP
jgi:putative membrane protein insertion efficiency factor